MEKRIFYFIVIAVLFHLTSVGQGLEMKNSPPAKDVAKNIHDAKDIFEILNIDSVQTVYVIYAKRNDSVIKIVSKKENLPYCRPVEKGQLYKLQVKSLLEHTASKRHIGGVKFNNILIKLQGDNVIWDLFTSDDLKGLCYVSALPSLRKTKKKKNL